MQSATKGIASAWLASGRARHIVATEVRVISFYCLAKVGDNTIIHPAMWPDDHGRTRAQDTIPSDFLSSAYRIA